MLASYLADLNNRYSNLDPFPRLGSSTSRSGDVTRGGKTNEANCRRKPPKSNEIMRTEEKRSNATLMRGEEEGRVRRERDSPTRKV